MRAEAWPDAAKTFQEAIDIDREFEDAYYGLGLANMRMKNYARGHRRLREVPRPLSRDGGQAVRQTGRMRNATGRIASPRSTRSSGSIRRARRPSATQDRLRQLQAAEERHPGLHLAREQHDASSSSVPAFVYLALGSAYFRTEQWPDAEREYKAAIAADPKSGEALNNLAVVYLQTGRYQEADEAVKSAEKAGYRVHPQLKLDIKAKLDR